MLFRSGCRQSDCHLVPSKERQRDGWIETRGHGCLRRLPSGVVRYPVQDPGLLRPGRLCPLRGKSRTASCFRNPSSDGPRPAGVRRSLAAPGGRGKRTAPRASWSTGSMLATGGRPLDLHGCRLCEPGASAIRAEYVPEQPPEPLPGSLPTRVHPGGTASVRGPVSSSTGSAAAATRPSQNRRSGGTA